LLEAALHQSLVPDQSSLDESTLFISSIKSQPDGALPFLALIQQTEIPPIRMTAIVNLYSLIKSNWPNIPSNIQITVREQILQILELPNLDSLELSVLADCSVLLFGSLVAAGSFWNEMLRLIGQSFIARKIPFTITLLSRIIFVIPDNIISQSYAAFRNMA
jgi:hypothetical protein